MSKPPRAFALPEMPQENNIIAHIATQWIQDAEALMAEHGLLVVSQGGMPAEANRIIDTPISTIPPSGGQLDRRADQQRLALVAENKRKQMMRDDLFLAAWTLLYTALLDSAKKTAPNHYEALKTTCNMSVHDPAWAQYFDGPKAWRMTLHLLRGRGRTKEDRAFYRAALEFQQKHPLSNGATADEYSKKARAFHLKINPNLAQPYTGEDISEYIIDLMPPDLRESGRRLTAQMKRDGTYLDHPEVIHECQELVRQEQSKSKTASAPPPAILVSIDALRQFGFPAGLASSTATLSDAMGMSLSLRESGARPRDGGVDGFVATPGGKKKWCDRCPHLNPKTKEELECCASPYYKGPPPPVLYCNEKLWQTITAKRSANCKSAGVRETPVTPPTDEAISKFKRSFKGRIRSQKAAGSDGTANGGTPGGVATGTDDFFSDLQDVYAVGVIEDQSIQD